MFSAQSVSIAVLMVAVSMVAVGACEMCGGDTPCIRSHRESGWDGNSTARGANRTPHRGVFGLRRVLLVPRTSPDTRNRLLDAGRRLFAERGVLAPTLDEVRREAEVSVGALYHHFTDKQALAAAVYAQILGEYQNGFLEMLTAQATAEGGIRGGVDYHLRWVGTHRAQTRLLLGERLDSESLQAANQRFFRAVSDWWRPHHAYGALPPMRAGVTSALWLGPAQEYSRHWITESDKQVPPAVIAVFSDAAWATFRQDQ
jgi:AcrR family transcriptional regulator